MFVFNIINRKINKRLNEKKKKRNEEKEEAINANKLYCSAKNKQIIDGALGLNLLFVVLLK